MLGARIAGGLLGAALVLTSLTGCGRTPPNLTPVSGVVTQNGKPVPHAQVQFIPLIQGFGGEYIAEAVTDAQGRYELTCTMGSGGCACENLVVVSEGPLPDDARGSSPQAQMKASNFLASHANRPLPEKYWTAAESPLKVTVTVDHSKYDIDLTAATIGAAP